MHTEQHNGSLSDKFAEFGAAPSNELWNNIAAQLDKKKKRPFLLWWWIGGIGTGIASFLFFVFTSPKQAVTEKTNNTVSLITQRPTRIEKTRSSSPTRSSSVINSREFKPIEQSTVFNIIAANISKKENKVYDYQYFNLPENTTISNLPRSLKPIGIDQLNTSSSISRDSLPTRFQQPVPRSESRWIFGFHLGQSGGLGELSAKMYPSSTVDASLNYGDPSLTATLPVKQQWFANWSVNRRLGNSFYLESGISASLFSTGKETSYGSYSSVFARSFSLGIPLSMNYFVYKRGRFNLLAGAGLICQFPFYKRVTYIAAIDHSITQEKTSQLNYIGAISGTISVNYHLNEHTCLAFTPSIHYYMLQGKTRESAPLVQQHAWYGASVGLLFHP